MNRIRIPIRWRDFDPLGHVNTAVHVTLLETGRDIWLGTVLGPLFNQNQYVVVHIDVDFRAEISLDFAYVESSHEVTAVGTSSVTLRECLINPDGVTVTEARSVLVLWDPQSGRPRAVTGPERGALMQSGPDRHMAASGG